jgi:hypothetical protein
MPAVAEAGSSLFFQFDPGFRTELEQARRQWKGSPDPLEPGEFSNHSLKTPRLVKSERLQAAAHRLAGRLGLGVESVRAAIAYGGLQGTRR